MSQVIHTEDHRGKRAPNPQPPIRLPADTGCCSSTACRKSRLDGGPMCGDNSSNWEPSTFSKLPPCCQTRHQCVRRWRRSKRAPARGTVRYRYLKRHPRTKSGNSNSSRGSTGRGMRSTRRSWRASSGVKKRSVGRAGRGKFTFAELEELEADWEKIQRWLGRVRDRDFFDASQYRNAADALQHARSSLEIFTTAVYRSEGVAPERRDTAGALSRAENMSIGQQRRDVSR